MLKLTGAVMIVAASTLWGFIRADRLKRRQNCLGEIISAMKLLENEIIYGKRDIKSVLLGVGELQNAKIFKSCAAYIDELGVKDGFIRAAEEEMSILGTDKNILCAFAENLGMTGTDEQVKNIRHSVGLLENAKNSALENYEKSARLYRGGGVLAGLGAAILLM